MNGNSTGLESADPSRTEHALGRIRNALTLFNETAKTACDLSEHKLQREAEDAAGRLFVQVEQLERQLALHERRVDGEDPKDARQRETQEVAQGFSPGSGF